MNNLNRTKLLLPLIEQAPVPVDWPKKVGYPPKGIIRKTSYPANSKEMIDDEYPCSKEGKRLARSHAWMRPSKRIKVCGKIMKT